MIHADYHDYGKDDTRASDEQRFFPQPSPPHLDKPENVGQILSQLGFSKPLIARWLHAARANGSSLDDEILMADHVEERAFYGAMARYLRLPLQEHIDAGEVHYSAALDKQLTTPRVLRLYPKLTAPKLLIVPELGRLKAIASELKRFPHLRSNLCITTRSALQNAIWAAGSNNRSLRAINELSEQHPIHSARTILHGKQGIILGIGIGACAVALLNPTSYVFFALHLFCSGFYLLSNGLRFIALVPSLRFSRRGIRPLPQNSIPPIYSILVPLHRESEIIHQLIGALDALEWPRSRLDIKLICEADDNETLNALKAVRLGREYHIIHVPPSEPRTKPKALQYAMPSVRGQYVTIYDAEDRPHPQQLKEAYSTFYYGEQKLACLQAPLIITNISRSWISALFAAEYAALFRRVLPMLAALRLPLPLGGTSNHFKTAALRASGGWDPFNVAEDADLGMRLSRLGYHIGVMSLPTLEDAPTSKAIWMAQRMRWYKGWLISWLVMMREPAKTLQQFGLIRFIAAQLMVGGLLLSSLSHPLVLTYIGVTLYSVFSVGISNLPSYKLYLLGVDGFNIVGSYAAFWLLSHSALRPIERIRLGPRWLLTPVYWLMLSIAAWRALIELRTHPFRWNKTPHRPST